MSFDGLTSSRLKLVICQSYLRYLLLCHLIAIVKHKLISISTLKLNITFYCCCYLSHLPYEYIDILKLIEKELFWKLSQCAIFIFCVKTWVIIQKVLRLTRYKLLVPHVPDDVGPGPGVVDDALQPHLLLLLHHQLSSTLVTNQLRLGWRHWKYLQIYRKYFTWTKYFLAAISE